MIVAVSVSTGAILALGIAALFELEAGSALALALVLLGANLGALAGFRLTSRSRAADPRVQRRTMTLIDQTLPHMRLGLSPETAARTVQLLHDVMRLEAVGITDRERLLAFIGAGADHHKPGGEITSELTRRSLESREVLVASRLPEGECPEGGNGACPLKSLVVAPLICGEHAVGSLKVYQLDESPGTGLIELTRGLAGMLSLQLELALAHREAQLAETAKLDALRAQMNPHFLFNTLNTISMKARTDPEEARRLLIKLSDFLRYAMKYTGQTTTFGEEYFFVRTYLFLERARFGDRLKVRYDVDPQCLSLPVPVLMIQPLIENAVRHGIASKPEGGLVELKARLEPIGGALRIRVSDNGVGIDSDELTSLLSLERTEVSALANIYERLTRLYGGRASLEISSSPERGTDVSLSLPLGMN